MNGFELLTALAMGIGLAAACGFRVFVPLLVLAIAGRSGHLALAGNLDWLANDTALVVLGVATLMEVGAYYVPWLDNLLDTIATPAAGLAGTIAASSVLIDMDPLWQWGLAAIAGGGTALGVQAMTVGVRALSTAATAGAGNPAFATTEIAAALGLTALALFVPLAAAAGVIVMLTVVGRFLVRQWRRRPAAAPSDGPDASER